MDLAVVYFVCVTALSRICMVRDPRLYIQIRCNAKNQVLAKVSEKGTSEKLHAFVPRTNTENAFPGKKCIKYFTRIVLIYLLTFAFKYICCSQARKLPVCLCCCPCRFYHFITWAKWAPWWQELAPGHSTAWAPGSCLRSFEAPCPSTCLTSLLHSNKASSGRWL